MEGVYSRLNRIIVRNIRSQQLPTPATFRQPQILVYHLILKPGFFEAPKPRDSAPTSVREGPLRRPARNKNQRAGVLRFDKSQKLRVSKGDAK